MRVEEAQLPAIGEGRPFNAFDHTGVNKLRRRLFRKVRLQCFGLDGQDGFAIGPHDIVDRPLTVLDTVLADDRADAGPSKGGKDGIDEVRLGVGLTERGGSLLGEELRHRRQGSPNALLRLVLTVK